MRTMTKALRMWVVPLGLLAAATATPATVGAAPAAETYADPAKTDADFPLQGEYAGPLQSGTEQPRQYGVQLVALGDGKFLCVGYEDGLPGAGWTRDKAKHKAEAARKDNVLTFKLGERDFELRDGKILVRREGTEAGALAKVERSSPTLGAKPPAGAIVLFDGSSADHFKNGRLTEDKLLMEGVDAKHMISHGGTLHLEFRLPYQPKSRGQGRGNSGCYMMGRYETQMLDSFGLEGENNECGGIYTVSKPIVNMCLPPLTWQTYDIEFVAPKFDAAGKKTDNARLTVIHNGVLVQDNVEVPKNTPGGAAESPKEGPIFHLQNHGNPVRYRNIWFVEKK